MDVLHLPRQPYRRTILLAELPADKFKAVSSLIFDFTMKATLLFLTALTLLACDSFEIQPNNLQPQVQPTMGQNLAAYLTASQLAVQEDSLIACAFSGDYGFLPGGLPGEMRVLAYAYFPDVMFFYFRAEAGAGTAFTDFRFLPAPEAQPVANNFFEVLPRSAEGGNFIVAHRRGSRLFISNVIELKPDQPTVDGSGDLVVDLSAPANPDFSWGPDPGDNAIFFELLTDASGNVVSGTYTTEPSFRYYDLSNVVLNVSPGVPPAALPTDNAYRMTVMGVGGNNWVNFMLDVEF